MGNRDLVLIWILEIQFRTYVSSHLKGARKCPPKALCTDADQSLVEGCSLKC